MILETNYLIVVRADHPRHVAPRSCRMPAARSWIDRFSHQLIIRVFRRYDVLDITLTVVIILNRVKSRRRFLADLDDIKLHYSCDAFFYVARPSGLRFKTDILYLT